MTLIILTLIGIAAMYIFSENEKSITLSEAEIVDLVENILSAGTMAEAKFQDDRITEAFNDKMSEFTPKICFS